VVRDASVRLRGIGPVRVDYLVAGALLIALQAQIWTAEHEYARGVHAVIAVIVVAAVAVRRRWPLQVLVMVTVGSGVTLALYGPRLTGQGSALGLAMVLLFYGAGAFLQGLRSWLGLGLALAFAAIVSLPKESAPAALFDGIALVVLPWVVGRTRRAAAARERASRQLAEELDAERELHVRAAALGERVRLAREIHDVVAHSVSVMVIQAAGARIVMDNDPVRADMSLRSVERAGREALAEMRRLLGVLADGEELRVLAPQPGLEDLPELVSSTRSSGLNASIRVEGEPVAVSAGLSLCAYRVVQEALTNALKHAGPTDAEVNVRWSTDALELEVTDAGRGATVPVTGPGGHGIDGMRERAKLHGGSLDAGPGPGGGFIVRARIPLLAGSSA
jgi:signal transduction histidine kinase